MRTIILAALIMVGLVHSTEAQDVNEQFELCAVGEPQEAIEACTWLIQSSQLSSEELARVHSNRGAIYASILGQVDLAMEDYNEAIRLDANFADAYGNRGAAYHDLGEYRQAIRDLDQAIQLDGTDAWDFYNRGRVYVSTGEIGKAIADFDEAVRLAGDHPWVLNNRGYAYQLSGEFTRAIQDYEQAIRLDGNFTEAYDNLAWLLVIQPTVQDAARAVVLAERAVFLRDTAIRRDTLAAAYSLAGRTDDAVAAYEKAFRMDTYHARQMQAWLSMKGYFASAIDGVWSSEVREALETCVEAGCQVGVE